MHTRRLAPFLLGIWIGCSLLVSYIALTTLHARGDISLPGPAAKMVDKLGQEDMLLLLRFRAAEMARSWIGAWNSAQLLIGLLLLAALLLGSARKPVPLVLCTIMLGLAAFEYLGLYSELIYRGRETDFPPGNQSFDAQSRVWAIEQMYLGTEGLKLLVGGVLTSYLIAFSEGTTRVKRVRKRSSESSATAASGHST